eukprot:CAMPEP_0171471706 /NCGR_PEP_ID=MMETSP0946-20130122/860_1 /TAXON_ID=109269 /ORGANISM="Vaucheria litorea, Strain CCMP2940" /LENGTH=148 /DNA_ID=CAMNT_0012001239 /DNA_START=43 /DNA_END=492 /DNA_ORIENTATION=-
MSNLFYCRYYVGHKGIFGLESLEFELSSDGKLRYTNKSHYKKDIMIRKEMYVSPSVQQEMKRIVELSGILDLTDENWPEPNKEGRQELEVKLGKQHISFTCSKLGSLLHVQDSKDPEGLLTFYYLVQDLKCLVLTLISMHFKIKPIPM